MRIKKFFFEKLLLFRNNPRILLNWGYKFSNFFKENTLNHGERYDPNILKKFNLSDPGQEARYHFVKNYISLNDTVLDVACGTGYGTLMLSEECLHITGYDISKVAIQYALKHYKLGTNINFKQTDIFSIHDHADIVVSFETIEHVKRDIQDTILKLLSLSNKKLICSVPFEESPGVNKHHVHSNINEAAFIFLVEKYKVQFFYQSEDGIIGKEKKDIQTGSLIVLIDKSSQT